MNIVRLLPIIFACLLMAAHFSRADNSGPALICLIIPLALFIRRKYIIYTFTVLLLIGGLVWLSALISLVQIRIALQMPWIRLAIILGLVVLFTALSSLSFKNKKLRSYYNKGTKSAIASVSAFFITALILTIVQLKVKLPLLLLERFYPTAGWVEIFLLSMYAAWVTEKMLDPAKSVIWRRRIWLMFSIVFFSQLTLGLAGAEKLLMTGKLHLPIPAMIIAGPLYRSDLSIMIFLFLGTILLVGPAWCSYLCYFGGWDFLASQKKRKPKKMSGRRVFVQLIVLLVVIASALLLRYLGLPSIVATLAGLLFGVVGVGLMLFWSRRQGAMTHCVSYCPIGLITVWLGKISPFRLKINNTCTDCMICRLSCRYDALNKADIKKRKPAISCTLCGDCIQSCDEKAIEYRLFGFKSLNARIIFIVMVIAIHAAFLGLARI